MQTISETIHQLQLGKASTFEGLTVFPLFDNSSAREPDYLTLDEALEQGHAQIQEVSEGGEVSNLLFRNNSDRKVLLVDGDELVGAKQNRIINLSILVAAHSKIEIPVSCVEAHRWAYRSRQFGSKKRSMYSQARAAKSAQVSMNLKRVGERYSDQAEVWDNIADCSFDLGVESKTGSMEDIYEQHDGRLTAYREAFQVQDGQVGADSESYCALGIGEDLRLSGETLAGGALVAEDRVVHLAAFRRDTSEGMTGARGLRLRNRNGSVH